MNQVKFQNIKEYLESYNCFKDYCQHQDKHNTYRRWLNPLDHFIVAPITHYFSEKLSAALIQDPKCILPKSNENLREWYIKGNTSKRDKLKTFIRLLRPIASRHATETPILSTADKAMIVACRRLFLLSSDLERALKYSKILVEAIPPKRPALLDQLPKTSNLYHLTLMHTHSLERRHKRAKEKLNDSKWTKPYLYAAWGAHRLLPESWVNRYIEFILKKEHQLSQPLYIVKRGITSAVSDSVTRTAFSTFLYPLIVSASISLLRYAAPNTIQRIEETIPSVVVNNISFIRSCATTCMWGYFFYPTLKKWSESYKEDFNPDNSVFTDTWKLIRSKFSLKGSTESNPGHGH